MNDLADYLLSKLEIREMELRESYNEFDLDNDDDNMTFVSGQLSECIKWKWELLNYEQNST